MITTSTHTLRLLIADASRRGVDVDEVLREAGPEAADVRRALDDPEARIPESTQRLIGFMLITRIDDPNWGLTLTEGMPPGTFGILGYVFRNSETLGDSYARTVRFARLINDAAQPSFEPVDDHMRFSLRFDDPTPMPPIGVRGRAQIWLSTLLRVGRRITGSHFVPERVGMSFAQPDDLEPYRAVFGCTPEFATPESFIELSPAVAALPVVAPDHDLASVMERYAESLLDGMPDHSDIGLRVRQATCRAVEAGDPRLPGVARELGMSPRSLQRKLQGAEISFSEVLDEVRRELALGYLQESALSVDQVAGVLGFASGSSFAKAFRRWTGQAPARYRAQFASSADTPPGA